MEFFYSSELSAFVVVCTRFGPPVFCHEKRKGEPRVHIDVVNSCSVKGKLLFSDIAVYTLINNHSIILLKL